MTEYHDHRDDCPFKFATLDVCDCVEKNMLDRIEALTAKLAKAVEKFAALEKAASDVARRGAETGLAAADRIEALTAKVKLMYDLDAINGEKIEALEAKLAKAVEGLHAVVQHEASTFFGPDGEKNKRASWRGVMRKARATLAEIKGGNDAKSDL